LRNERFQSIGCCFQHRAFAREKVWGKFSSSPKAPKPARAAMRSGEGEQRGQEGTERARVGNGAELARQASGSEKESNAAEISSAPEVVLEFKRRLEIGAVAAVRASKGRSQARRLIFRSVSPPRPLPLPPLPPSPSSPPPLRLPLFCSRPLPLFPSPSPPLPFVERAIKSPPCSQPSPATSSSPRFPAPALLPSNSTVARSLTPAARRGSRGAHPGTRSGQLELPRGCQRLSGSPQGA
jgi:hypothetical protein